MSMRRLLLLGITFVASSALAQNSLPTVTQPTGGQVTTLTVQGGNRSLFKVALPQWTGDADTEQHCRDSAGTRAPQVREYDRALDLRTGRKRPNPSLVNDGAPRPDDEPERLRLQFAALDTDSHSAAVARG